MKGGRGKGRAENASWMTWVIKEGPLVLKPLISA